MWAKNSAVTYSYLLDGSLIMAAIDGKAFMLGSVSQIGVGDFPLTTFAIPTGEVLEKPLLLEGRPSTIALNTNALYVGFDGTQKVSGEMTNGAARVTAYQLNTLTPLWTKTIGGARGIPSMMATNTIVSVRGNSSSHYYLLDAQSGEVMEKRPLSENFVWFTGAEVSYEDSKTSSLEAWRQQTRELVWRSAINGTISQPPILTDAVIVARTKDLGFMGTVIAINRANGQKMWENGNVASNVAVSHAAERYFHYGCGTQNRATNR